jgi:3-mercaptopyruvate sulfurtransferase SseA
MARLLHTKGYSEVWPLLGGFDAWLALGYPVEQYAARPRLASIAAASAS